MALNVGELYAKLGIDTREFDRKLDTSGRRFEGFGRSMGRVATGAAIGAGAALAGFAAKGLAEFGKLERGMNEVFTLLPGISDQAMGEMTGQVRDFAKEFGTLPDEVVPALYQAISAGVPKDNVFDFLETAQKAAVGGVTELSTAVDGISSVVNAYGEDVVDATQASDLMFTAVRLGKTDFDQLSRSLFNVIPTASGLGVEFRDITAALAAMTAQGTPTSVATTQLRQLLVELSKEGMKTADTFREIAGVGFREFIASGGTLEEALGMMADAASSSGGTVADMFGSVEAGAAAMALTSESGAQAFGNAMGEMADAAGATEAAYDQMDQGLSRTVDKLKARFNDLALEMGEELADTATESGERLLDLAENSVPLLDGALQLLGKSALGTTIIFDGLGDAFGLSDGRAADLARSLILVEGYLNDGADPIDAYKAALVNLSETGPLTEDQIKRVGRAAGLTGSEMNSANKDLAEHGRWLEELTDNHAGLVQLYDDLRNDVPGAADRLADFNIVVAEGEDPVQAVGRMLERMAQQMREAQGDGENLTGAFEEMKGPLTDAEGNISRVAGGVTDYMKAAEDGAEATDDFAGSQGNLEDETRGATAALREQFDLLRSQIDPMFALREASDQVAEAQAAVNEAASEYGEGSDEHLDAIANLAEANLDLRDAEIRVQEAGKLTRDEFVKQQVELGLTREEAERLADEFERLDSFQFKPKSIVITTTQGLSDDTYGYGAGRAFGGNVRRGGMYPTGEGNLPEILHQNGRQYLIPGDQGRVVTMDQMARMSGGAPSLAAMRSAVSDAAGIAAKVLIGAGGGPVSRNTTINLEGTGDPKVDAMRVGAAAQVVEFMEIY